MDPDSLPKWDRGVARVRPTSAAPVRIGFTFDTLAHSRHRGDTTERGRMSYRVADFAPGRFYGLELTDSVLFKQAHWLFELKAVPEGTHVMCTIRFTLRWPYVFLAPILWARRAALSADLVHLKRVLEAAE